MSDDLVRSVDVFFYGLFMDEEILRAKGLDPKQRRLAEVRDFRLVIGERATLVSSQGDAVHGVVFALTHPELDSLYSEPSVSVYRPEAVIATLADGNSVPALCFNLPSLESANRNLAYAGKLAELAARIGLPSGYVDSIKSS
jgi:hypothetical protein